jgi:hypothetical protein
MPILAGWTPMEAITTARRVNITTTENRQPNQQQKKKRTGSVRRARLTIKAADIIELAKGMPVTRLTA